MKRWLPLAFPIGLISAVLVFTALRGSIFGVRQPLFPPSVEVVSADVVLGYVDLTVRNNALHQITAEAWYALIDPATNAVVYTSDLIVAPYIAPRANAIMSAAIPEAYDPAAYRVEGGAREVIAYVSDAIDPRMIIEGGLLPTQSDMQIRSAELTPLGEGRYRVQAELRLLSETNSDFRYILSLIPVTESEDGDLSPGAEAFRSQFTPISLAADEPRTEAFSAETTLAPGRYTLSLWLQIASGDGGFEHYEQVTYARLLEVES